MTMIERDNNIYTQKGYIGIFYVFFHIFGDFLEVRYIRPPVRAKNFMLGTPSTQILGENRKKSSTRGAQGPPFFSIIPRSVLSGVLLRVVAAQKILASYKSRMPHELIFVLKVY